MADRHVLRDKPVAAVLPLGSWVERAACAGMVALFDSAEPDAPLAVCARCPVRAACRGWSLRTAVAGVAGGLTEDDRMIWRAANSVPEPHADLARFLPADVVAADVANEALPDRHLRLVWPPREISTAR